jgi:hypothetical protein
MTMRFWGVAEEETAVHRRVDIFSSPAAVGFPSITTTTTPLNLLRDVEPLSHVISNGDVFNVRTAEEETRHKQG